MRSRSVHRLTMTEQRHYIVEYGVWLTWSDCDDPESILKKLFNKGHKDKYKIYVTAIGFSTQWYAWYCWTKLDGKGHTNKSTMQVRAKKLLHFFLLVE